MINVDDDELKKREDFSEAVIRERRREKRSDTSATQSFKSLGVVVAMYCTYQSGFESGDVRVNRLYRMCVTPAGEQQCGSIYPHAWIESIYLIQVA